MGHNFGLFLRKDKYQCYRDGRVFTKRPIFYDLRANSAGMNQEGHRETICKGKVELLHAQTLSMNLCKSTSVISFTSNCHDMEALHNFWSSKSLLSSKAVYLHSVVLETALNFL